MLTGIKARAEQKRDHGGSRGSTRATGCTATRPAGRPEIPARHRVVPFSRDEIPLRQRDRARATYCGEVGQVAARTWILAAASFTSIPPATTIPRRKVVYRRGRPFDFVRGLAGHVQDGIDVDVRRQVQLRAYGVDPCIYWDFAPFHRWWARGTQVRGAPA